MGVGEAWGGHTSLDNLCHFLEVLGQDADVTSHKQPASRKLDTQCGKLKHSTTLGRSEIKIEI